MALWLETSSKFVVLLGSRSRSRAKRLENFDRFTFENRAPSRDILEISSIHLIKDIFLEIMI